MTPRIREPVVAGAFYPGTEDALRAQLGALFGEGFATPRTPLRGSAGIVAPHAGYLYCGKTAAAGYRWLAAQGRPEWILVVGANHTGRGAPVSVGSAGGWRTPLALHPVAEAAGVEGAGLTVDDAAFAGEHSLEVQLPFLFHAYGDAIPWVPVCVMTRRFDRLDAAAERLAEKVGTAAVAVVASSDFTHYEPQSVAEAKDRDAIERLLANDVRGFLETVERRGLTICGAGAIALMLLVGRRLGWGSGELLSYSTSGDASGDQGSVVGYAAAGWRKADDDS